MKGFTPNFSTVKKKEVSSKKNKTSFIELGIKQKHPQDCKCEKCAELNK